MTKMNECDARMKNERCVPVLYGCSVIFIRNKHIKVFKKLQVKFILLCRVQDYKSKKVQDDSADTSYRLYSFFFTPFRFPETLPGTNLTLSYLRKFYSLSI
jgi:hypothetical protein